MLCVAQQAGEEVMRGQVLERGEALADHSHLLGREGSTSTIEARDGLARAEVSGGPRPGAGEVAGEEPVCRPLADPGRCRESKEVKVTARIESPTLVS